MFQEQKLPDIGGDIDRHVPPKVNIGGTRPREWVEFNAPLDTIQVISEAEKGHVPPVP